MRQLNDGFPRIADIPNLTEIARMQWLLVVLGIVVLIGTNYLATRMLGSRIGKAFFLITSLPAIIAIAYTGFCFAYAIINAEEVNRRFRSGDLTYFGADIAFGGSLLLGGLWLFLTYTGHQWGREDHRSV